MPLEQQVHLNIKIGLKMRRVIAAAAKIEGKNIGDFVSDVMSKDKNIIVLQKNNVTQKKGE